MIHRLLLVLALVPACTALPDDGALLCNPDPAHSCPDGFSCADDGRCYRTGHLPPTDMGAASDMEAAVCASSSTCSAATPVCTEQVCSPCATEGMSTECATYHPDRPLCGPTGGCVQCFTKDQCEAAHQTCDLTTYACAPCKAHGECSSGYCNLATGVCSDKSMQYYVSNAPTAGCTDNGPGTFAIPFCTIQKAIDTSAANGGKTVVVFGGTYGESVQVTQSSADYVTTAVGIDGPVIKSPAAAPSLSIQGAGTLHTTVTLDGFVFDGGAISDGSPVVEIGGGATAYGLDVVTLTHATIRNGTGIALLAHSKSNVIVDSVDIHDNVGGGLRFDGADFELTNALIRSNGSPTANYSGLGVTAAGETGKTKIANVTIVSNTTASSSTLPSGLGCLAPVSTMINTVIIGNNGGPGEINAACTTPGGSNAYVGAPSGNENLPTTCLLTDLFANPGNADYHPKKGGAVPCTLVDQGTTNGAPDHDLEGVPRPQPAGGLDDVGAYEAR